jgi:hypothetical protein
LTTDAVCGSKGGEERYGKRQQGNRLRYTGLGDTSKTRQETGYLLFWYRKFRMFEKDISKYLVFFADKPKLKISPVHGFLGGVTGLWSTHYLKKNRADFG